MYLTDVNLRDGLDHGLRFSRSIVGLDKEVRGELWDIEDICDSALSIELNNPSLESAWYRTCTAKMTCVIHGRIFTDAGYE